MTARTLPKVLCVDDEPALLRSLRWLLRGEFEVTIASDPAQALAILGADRFDVIISDQRMPGMTGTEFLQHAKVTAPHAMRLLLTGYADFGAVVSALNDGDVFRYISKPWDNTKLIRAVQEAARLARMSRTRWSDFQDTHAPEDADEPPEELLLVEPDPALRLAVQQAGLENARVMVADDSADALTLLEQRPVAVVVIRQTRGSGGTNNLVRAIKRRKPRLSVVICSEEHDIHALQHLINEGLIHRYVSLPTDAGVIKQALESAIDRHRELRQKPHRLANARARRSLAGSASARAAASAASAAAASSAEPGSPLPHLSMGSALPWWARMARWLQPFR
jgi:DNA-binding NtrC family response regulator